MDFLKRNKTALIGIVVLLAAGYVYFTYFSGGSATPTLSSSDATTAVSQNLLVTLQNLHTIKLDDSVFSDPAFQSLTDFGVTIPPQTVGRQDPFSPLSSSGAASSGTKLPLPPGTN